MEGFFRKLLGFIFAFCFIQSFECFSVEAIRYPEIQHIHIDGDIMLGGLFPVHKTSKLTEISCGVIDPQPGFQYMAAMLFALEQINKNTDVLPNITLGASIYDTCRSQTIGADRAKDIIKSTLLEGVKPLVGVVGPLTSDVSISVANLLRVFDIPQISYGATTVDLSNKELYGNFFRTVPPDSFQARALVDVILHYGWNYVFAINSYGNYAERGMELFLRQARLAGICIAREAGLPKLPSENTYRKVIENTMNHREGHARVVVIFTTQTDAAGLLRAAEKSGVKGLTWLGSTGWSDRGDVTEGNERIANGSLTVGHRDGIVQGFLDFLINLNNPESVFANQSKNTWFDEFLQSVLKCNVARNGTGSGTPDTPSCNIPGSLLRLRTMELAPIRVVVNAVYAFAYALDNIQKDHCPGQSGICEQMKNNFQGKHLLEYLKNVTFPDSAFKSTVKFNAEQEITGHYSIINFQQGTDGQWKYVVVGSWRALPNGKADKLKIKKDLVRWGNVKNEPPLSHCSASCAWNEFKIRRISKKPCCWECKQCKNYKIVFNDSCVRCPSGYKPDARLSSCIFIERTYPKWSNPLSATLAVLAGALIVVALLTFAFYVQKRKHCVIKSAGRELCLLIFIGVILCFVSSMMQLLKPTDVVCALRRYLGSVCFTLCYAPLLIKTNRIYRIFTHAQQSAARPPLVRPLSQVLISIGLIAVQLLITTVWTLSESPKAIVQYPSSFQALLVCSISAVTVAVNMAYNILLMFLCTVFAFKTRRFPRNFNEAKQIGITMYITCSIWIIYFPTYVNAKTAAWGDFINCCLYLVGGCVNLFGLLVPKVIIVVWGKVSVESSQAIIEPSHEQHDQHVMHSVRNTKLVFPVLQEVPPSQKNRKTMVARM